MQRNALRAYDQPDLSNYVVHLTGRSGPKLEAVPATIQRSTAKQRLYSILHDQFISAFPCFNTAPMEPQPVVCFSEATPAGITAMIAASRYAPYGIGFRKECVFAKGGGPAFYVRGDEWEQLADAPPSVQARATRYWPGAVGEDGENLPTYLSSPSEWAPEREWRVPCPDGLPFSFSWSDISFILAPELQLRGEMSQLLSQYDDIYGEYYSRIPMIVVSADGQLVVDETGIWQ